jgi:DnaJ like chaperone protein
MFPSTLSASLMALPFSVACLVAPPEALLPNFGAASMGDTLVIVNGRLVGLLPAETPDLPSAVFGLLRASLSPWLGQPNAERADAWSSDDAADPFEVLGVSPADPFERVRAAWRARLAEYHPDRYAQAGAKIRAVAEDESRRLNAAFARIAAHRGRITLPDV